MKKSILVDEAPHRRAKLAAVAQGRTLKGVVEELLEIYAELQAEGQLRDEADKQPGDTHRYGGMEK